MALFYSDGGPGPPTTILRVNVSGNGSDRSAWRAASADRWTVASGWVPAPTAHDDILWLGELFMFDASELPKLQQQMRDEYAKYSPLPSGHA